MSTTARVIRLARPAATAVKQSQRRNVTTVPRLGTEEQMKAEALEQIKARVAYQKELMKHQGHGPEEEVAEMYKWINITFMVGIPVCIASTIFSYVNEKHAHRAEGEVPEYLKIRSKEFPWQCGDCDLFDMKCWKKCKSEM